MEQAIKPNDYAGEQRKSHLEHKARTPAYTVLETLYALQQERPEKKIPPIRAWVVF